MAETDDLKQAVQFMYGSVRTPEGFWYSHQVKDVTGLTVAQWLFITAAHTALHVGKIQLLRALVEGRQDRPC